MSRVIRFHLDLPEVALVALEDEAVGAEELAVLGAQTPVAVGARHV